MSDFDIFLLVCAMVLYVGVAVVIVINEPYDWDEEF